MNCSGRDIVVVGNGNTVRVDLPEGYSNVNCNPFSQMHLFNIVAVGLICICIVLCMLWYCYRRRHQERRRQRMNTCTQNFDKNNADNC
jgi:uncharacterized membrane protein YukC